MKLAKSTLLLTSLLCGAIATTACTTYPSHGYRYGYDYDRYDRYGYNYDRYGYPYGYRDGYSYYRPDLRYDNRLGVYIVVGMPNHYYYDDRFYRYRGDRWYSSTQLSGGWRQTSYRRLPPGLANRYGRA